MTETTRPAHRVSVIGTGAIGGAVARRLLAAGHEVTVWNRTASRSAGLVEAGALPAGSPGEAASSATLILLTLTDYAAVLRCLAEPDADLSGRTIVVMCTGTAGDARQAARRVAALGADYLDAGVQASPETIGTDAATILYSGSRPAFERHLTTLGALSRPHFVGDTPEAAAIWDLALFGVWYDAQLGLLRALDTVREAGIDLTEFSHTAAVQLGHVVTAVPATVSELLRADYPAGPADLTGHLTVVRHLIGLRSDRRLGDGGLPAAAARIEELIADRRGGEGLTATIG
ncbi:NAD(P)-dependent oxidoreductase [Streptosporangium lutulentum]|uniref:3-hydroxyisobutyrate dehydrogenase-like beta-hydroxyacid dehydrogenase n=1 Tax=Streptosporangium lutulentum TaxID=1461250 RepID=A0ABT9QCH7_9ACTN|nr:NAD(P)-binding domain-containing protein [Streptosporangium lutulentum]MDP9844441.1 3-hydroxyisobutyrate dehydrogenase-like beta-hydroxyacid dehydrogenase [Streptosporangium lutulentum]